MRGERREGAFRSNWFGETSGVEDRVQGDRIRSTLRSRLNTIR